MNDSFEGEMRNRAHRVDEGKRAKEAERRDAVKRHEQQAADEFAPLHARLLKASEFLRNSGVAPEITLYSSFAYQKLKEMPSRPVTPRGAPQIRERYLNGGGHYALIGGTYLGDTFVEVGRGWEVLFACEESTDLSFSRWVYVLTTSGFVATTSSRADWSVVEPWRFGSKNLRGSWRGASQHRRGATKVLVSPRWQAYVPDEFWDGVALRANGSDRAELSFDYRTPLSVFRPPE